MNNKVLKPKKFIFRWSNNNINKNRPNIIQYDLNNNIIKIFDNNYSSIKMISEEINISEATIRLHLQNKIKKLNQKNLYLNMKSKLLKITTNIFYTPLLLSLIYLIHF